MSKTVLLPDDLHKQIKDCKLRIDWIPMNLSMAKKIEFFVNSYLSN
jgi:hypothetical protein